MSLGHNPDGCIKQKRGGLELKRKKKANAGAITLPENYN